MPASGGGYLLWDRSSQPTASRGEWPTKGRMECSMAQKAKKERKGMQHGVVQKVLHCIMCTLD